MRIAIVLLFFDRHEYIKEVAESLSKQRSIENKDVFVFSDGVINRHSGKKRASEDDINKSRSIVEKILPNAKRYYSEYNIGIGLMFDWIHNELFDKEKYDWVYFFEDDMILSPFYIEALDKLRDLEDTHDAGIIAAYGNHKIGIEEQIRNKDHIIPMHHLWGFGMSIRTYEKIRKMWKMYISLIENKDYRERDHTKIRKLLSSWTGSNIATTSQDSARRTSIESLGMKLLMCTPCYGKYIGKVGIHFNENIYNDNLFGNALLQDRLII